MKKKSKGKEFHSNLGAWDLSRGREAGKGAKSVTSLCTKKS